MRAQEIVCVLLEVEEPFDARDYLTQSSLEVTAKRLGMAWLDWNVWYKEIGPWRLYIDPWKQNDWMEVEIGYDNTHDQAVVFDRIYHQNDAHDIIPKVVALLGSIGPMSAEDNRVQKWPEGADAKIEALMSTFPRAVTDSQEDFSAREFFNDMELPGQRVADALGFDTIGGSHSSPRKIIGQWVVYLTPGSNYNLVNLYRDYGWQTEPKGQWYLKDDDVERVTTAIVHILQAHTSESGWCVGEEAAYRELGAIPK